MKVPLYILGFLSRYGAQHGYRLKQYLEHISDFASIKLPTIYHHLRKMEGEGLITASQEKEGNRPERTVYTITSAGQDALQEMLKNALATSYRGEFLLDAGLYFYELLEGQQILEALRDHVNKLEHALQEIASHKSDVLQQQTGLVRVFTRAIFHHHECHAQAERQWLQETVGELCQYLQNTEKNSV